ncbi:MAG: sugar transferase [Pseudomonadota bacterium]
MPFDAQSSHLEMKSSTQSAAIVQENITLGFPVSYAGGVKRLLDICIVLASAFIVVPLIILMALAVALDGHAPFYVQKRVGRNGKIFKILKIRTMVHNADALLKQHLSENSDLQAEWDNTQKLKEDIRVTQIGRLLRKTSMDELPQLYNVLMGSMSLVGPRPMMPSQRKLYPGNSYYRLRPGITGFWQISDRNACNFSDRAKYDAAYEQALSFKTDALVLFRTVFVVLRGTGY